MGVLNVTPDSFSDGGCWLDPTDAVRHGLDLTAQGADLIDVGGESTRPGSQRVPVEVEQQRILPVVRPLVEAGVTLSIDTMNAATALATAQAGAVYINDVSAGLADPDMFDAVSDTDARLILSHWRGLLSPGHAPAHYDDVLGEVLAELEQRVEAARAAGIDDSRLILDPGLGFSKNAEHNWQIINGFDRLLAFGLPVMIGASRKRFVGRLLPAALREPDADPAAVLRAKDAATAAISALMAHRGVWGFRVHDVAATAAALAAAERFEPTEGEHR
ncbi:dihydropteroate synthase [Pseudoclavibacter sp. CFCC 13796]|uniref:dihydropteroate synthase n=1 Tax=Pseudoclavibacter sp. CFCC 13796 TaxID=2615179 RepID=UPI0013013AB1|nr:dihydropteroate synthase [Pseudoclavibacter sp. CFCC 13796]KAB1662039.1 dihydropteroate synthase [Pseudoclavibacter sp. CFCC 13796]